jgi:hypothetical protein
MLTIAYKLFKLKTLPNSNMKMPEIVKHESLKNTDCHHFILRSNADWLCAPFI